jgi:hypothetical protein
MSMYISISRYQAYRTFQQTDLSPSLHRFPPCSAYYSLVLTLAERDGTSCSPTMTHLPTSERRCNPSKVYLHLALSSPQNLPADRSQSVIAQVSSLLGLQRRSEVGRCVIVGEVYYRPHPPHLPGFSSSSPAMRTIEETRYFP